MTTHSLFANVGENNSEYSELSLPEDMIKTDHPIQIQKPKREIPKVG